MQKEVCQALARCENAHPNSVETGHLRILVEQFLQKDAPKNAVDVANLQTDLDAILSQCRRSDPF